MIASIQVVDPMRAAQEQERRKNRLMAILSKGIPTLPRYVLELNNLLGSASVDLKKVSKIIRTDPSLTAVVLRLCNSALFGLRRRVISIEQAAVLLGVERLRTLVLTCSVMQFSGKQLSTERLKAFWQHSFLAALLSERIAKQIGYFEKEQAYLGGLLHDIGQLSLWLLVVEEEAGDRGLPPDNWVDNVLLEREYFGMDHCKVGRKLATDWNFMPSFVDVFEFHHAVDKAKHDPYLVGIVAVADQFLNLQANNDAAPSEDRPELQQPADPSQAPERFIEACLPSLGQAECASLLDMMRTEYIHFLPLVQLGLSRPTTGPADQG